jgi:hypothetical protein
MHMREMSRVVGIRPCGRIRTGNLLDVTGATVVERIEALYPVELRTFSETELGGRITLPGTRGAGTPTWIVRKDN